MDAASDTGGPDVSASAGGSTGAGGASLSDAASDGAADVHGDVHGDVATGAGGAAGSAGDGSVADTRVDANSANDAGVPDAGEAAAAPACGFLMPNPVASGLPNPARYDTTVNGIVTDQVTGLLYCPLRYADEYCAANRLGGYSDWRLPTVLEAASLLDFTQWYPSIDLTAFSDTPYENFWTSTRPPGQLDNAWYVSFAYGSMGTTFIDTPAHVRCVRDGGTPPKRCAPAGGRYQPSADLVFDTITGLTWQKGVGSSMSSPAMAATYCSSLGGGFRLPSIKELLTLVNYGANPSLTSMLDPVFDRPQSFFWSSSASLATYMGIWTLDLQSGGGAPSQAATFYTNGAVKCVK